VLLQGPGVGLLLLLDALEGVARQWSHLAAHVEQLKLGVGLGQEFGQRIDGGHEVIRLRVMRADYKEVAQDSQWGRAARHLARYAWSGSRHGSSPVLPAARGMAEDRGEGV